MSRLAAFRPALTTPLLALLPAALALAHPAAAAPRVVTDIPPIHSIVARVMEGAGTPALLLAPGASPHDYALRPSDAQAVSAADLLVWVGPGLDPWLGEAAQNLGTTARNLALDAAPGMILLPPRAGGAFEPDDHHHHDHAAGEATPGDAHGAAHGQDADGHDAEDPDAADPHIWLDPQNAVTIAQAAADALAAIDPGNAALYAANATAFAAEADALQAEVAAGLAPARGKGFIVFHDAYQYFETRFGIPAVGSILLQDAERPSAARIAALRERVERADVTCVFAEPVFPPALVETLIDGTSVRAGSLDDLGGSLGMAPGPALYPALIRALGRNLTGCLVSAS